MARKKSKAKQPKTKQQAQTTNRPQPVARRPQRQAAQTQPPPVVARRPQRQAVQQIRTRSSGTYCLSRGPPAPPRSPFDDAGVASALQDAGLIWPRVHSRRLDAPARRDEPRGFSEERRDLAAVARYLYVVPLEGNNRTAPMVPQAGARLHLATETGSPSRRPRTTRRARPRRSSRRCTRCGRRAGAARSRSLLRPGPPHRRAAERLSFRLRRRGVALGARRPSINFVAGAGERPLRLRAVKRHALRHRRRRQPREPVFSGAAPGRRRPGSTAAAEPTALRSVGLRGAARAGGARGILDGGGRRRGGPRGDADGGRTTLAPTRGRTGPTWCSSATRATSGRRSATLFLPWRHIMFRVPRAGSELARRRNRAVRLAFRQPPPTRRRSRERRAADLLDERAARGPRAESPARDGWAHR